VNDVCVRERPVNTEAERVRSWNSPA